MCGIVAGFSKKGKRISKSVMKRYTNQKHRGSQGFGYVAFYKDGNGGRIAIGRSVDENGIRTQIMNEHSSMIMFHHRFPTSTPNVIEATHPIYVSNDELDYDYFVVHNGVIRNSDELRKQHEALGYVYNTVIETEVITHHKSRKTGEKYFVAGTKTEKFNDSESLAIEVARVLDGMTSRINTVGTVATIAWKINKETGKLVSISYGHNAGNPMTITDNNDHFFLSSVGGTDIPEDILYTLSTDGDSIGTTTQREMSIGFNTEYAKTNGSNSFAYNYTRPLLPSQTINKSINDDVKAKYIDRSSKEYYEDTYGFNSEKRSEWDREGEKLNKVGFTTEGNVDTTKDSLSENFMKVSGLMVKAYLELEDMKISVMSDIDAAEYMLQDINIDNKSRNILTVEVTESEEKLDAIQGKMNEIEDRYVEAFPSRSSFKVLVDAYIEQQGEEFDGIPYDIQMDERNEYELGKVV